MIIHFSNSFPVGFSVLTEIFLFKTRFLDLHSHFGHKREERAAELFVSAVGYDLKVLCWKSLNSENELVQFSHFAGFHTSLVCTRDRKVRYK